MKNLKLINPIYIIITLAAALVISLYFNLKPVNKEVVIVEVPPIQGEFKRDSISLSLPLPKPSTEPNTIIFSTIHDTIVVYDTITTYDMVDLKLFKNFQELVKSSSLNDSLERVRELLNHQLDALKIREYNEVYENEFVIAEVNSTVTGKLRDQSLKFTTKPFTIEKEVKSKNTNVYLGGGVEYDYLTREPSLMGNIGITNKKNLINLGVTTDKKIIVNYNRTIF